MNSHIRTPTQNPFLAPDHSRFPQCGFFRRHRSPAVFLCPTRRQAFSCWPSSRPPLRRVFDIFAFRTQGPRPHPFSISPNAPLPGSSCRVYLCSCTRNVRRFGFPDTTSRCFVNGSKVSPQVSSTQTFRILSPPLSTKALTWSWLL